MAKKEKQQQAEETILIPEVTEETQETPETPEAPETEQVNPWEEKYNAERDAHLRVAAEFDNFRKRTVKEKEASYGNGKADAVAKILPVYDNLERALNQETSDAAYKKGVEMTMNELVKILNGLGVEIFGEVGDAFDPNLHNAVMHIDSEELEENVIAQVFQKGFKIGDKIVRFAMVQVAN
ncbi:MAG TPA: nucleotide exchange factor GrpE [Candidatus Faecousia faecavium]|nr:nucleotide exchange factor GrpE [Candidatus Faecousia faecavium]